MQIQKWTLAPFERYMLADDTHMYSMTCHIRLWFSQRPQRAPWENALRVALERHPMLRSRLVRQPDGTLCFVPEPPAPDDIVTWLGVDEPLQLKPQQTPDLRLRLFMKDEVDNHLVAIQFHHSICDGIGIFRFMEDLLLSYDALLGGRAAALPPLVENQLLLRLHFGLSPAGWRARLGWDLSRALRFFGGLAAPLAPPLASEHQDRQPKASAEEKPAASLAAETSVRLTAEKTRQILRSAREQSVTLNDLLLERLFRVCDVWNAAKGRRPLFRCTRISVPTSLRTEEDEVMPAANCMSMVFLDRFRWQIAGPGLRASIVKEMGLVKERRLGLTLARVVGLLQKISGDSMLGLLRTPLCMASVVLTNLGRPFQGSPLMRADGFLRAGDLTLVGLDTMPPVRQRTGFAISVNGYSGRLRMTLRYDSLRYSQDDAKSFLSLYLKDVESLCAESSAAPVPLNALKATP